MIAIIDYNAGNPSSIMNMLKKLGSSSIITNSLDDIKFADKFILPGVGKFDYGMKNLIDTGIIPVLEDRVIKNHIPILGICLGVQLMGRGSEEGILKGLSWLDVDTVSFKNSSINDRYSIPHMGWSQINLIKKDSILRNNKNYPLQRFYHVHSYYLKTSNSDQILATSQYGNFEFVSAMCNDNIIGVQFHPEKSHKYGMQLFENFIKL